MKNSRAFGIALIVCAMAVNAPAQILRRGRQLAVPGGAGMVSLPYTSSDAQGNQWMVFGPGSVQMQGNMPVFNQAGQLLVNNVQPNVINNMARLDEKTGELLLENMQAGAVSVTRRLLLKPDTNTVRFIDIISNPAGAAQTVTLRFTTNLNFGVQSATLVPDPKHKGQNLAWVAQTNNAQAAFEWVGAPGAKVLPTLNWTQGSPFIQSTLTLSIPGNGKVAVLHVDGAADTTATAQKWVDDVKVNTLLADVPADVRKLIVNVPARTTGLSTDVELLRGNLLDVVELMGGDHIVGTIAAGNFTVQTAFGPTTLASEHLLGVVPGTAQPLWVLDDGQMLAGPADAPTLRLDSAGGGAMQIAWTQINRIGFRRRLTESADSADGVPPIATPAVALIAGDRLRLTPTVEALDVLTRYGLLHVPTTAVAGISFTDAEVPVDVVTLTDGSRFAGLAAARTVTGNAPQLGDKPITLDVSRIRVLQLHDAVDDARSAAAPALVTTTGNTFVGTLQKPVTLRTPAGPVTLDPEVVSSAAVGDDADHTMKVTTADGTTITGLPTDSDWAAKTAAGVELSIPTSEIKSYLNPTAGPSTMSRTSLDPWIAQLGADDWKQRDAAEHQLLKLGPAVGPSLRQARDKQPPEAQQRIDSILKQLDAKPGS